MRTYSGLHLTEYWAPDRFKTIKRIDVLYVRSRACGMNARPKTYIGKDLIIHIAMPKMYKSNRSVL